MSAKKGLGRGLDALIPAGPARAKAGGLISCPIETITIGKFQPRQKIDPAKIAELAESIKAQGILQPLLVRPRAGGGYELIAGERRLRAATAAGLAEVPVTVHEVDDRGAMELALVENLQREDLDPVEEAAAYRRLLTEFDYTQEQLSQRVGKDRATISNQLRLLTLPEDMVEDIRDGRLSAGHARALLRADGEKLMRQIRDAVVNEGLSVREAERWASGERRRKPEKKRAEQTAKALAVKAMEERLMRALGTKVKITSAGKGGAIHVQFFSQEELDRLYRRLLG
jgi:ParB family transcriptional regulator, chromosome partitioning protein